MKLNNEDFVHLHVHNEFSVLDGLSLADDWANRAKELGFKALALTNHGNVDGVIKFQKACDEAGIKSIVGCELYLVKNMLDKDKDEKRYHATVLVKNQKGWENLLIMLTRANLNGFYKRPRIDPETLLDLCDGLVVMTACSSSFLNAPFGFQLFEELGKRTDVALEVMPLGIDEQIELNMKIVDYVIDCNNNPIIVATGDCHYINKDDSKLQEVLLCIQSKDKWRNPDRWKFSVDDLYLKTADEMYESFKAQGIFSDEQIISFLSNTRKVADLCNFTIEQRTPDLPKVFIREFEDLDENDQIIQLTVKGLEEKAKKYPHIAKDIDVYYEKIEDEFVEIIPRFTRYFLIVWELTNWCKMNGISTGPGRGSAASSVVSYCLGITNVDPIKYKLIFSRFISPGRIDLPDIDMDFEDRRREEVKRHLEELYGEWNVIEISNFLRMRGKAALKNVSRVFDVPLVEVNKATSCIVERSWGDMRSRFTLADAFATFNDGIAFKNKYPDVTEMAMKIEGQVFARGRHAAAVCVSQYDLRSGKNANFVVRDNHRMANWEKEDCEYMGLMKLDILGLNSLTILSEAKKLILDRHGIDLDYDLIDLDDSKLHDEFTIGNNVGIFQFNSDIMVKLCQEIKSSKFDDIVALNALNRPGVLRAGFANTYRDRKHGNKRIEYKHPWLESITKHTQGLLIYQEQVMRLMYELGGLPWKTADSVRKVISKSKGIEEFLKFKDQFVDGCERLGTLSREDADELFTSMQDSGSYLFNLSHSVSYSMIAVWQMHLKVYYPVEFMCTLLSYGPDAKKEDLINESKRLGIKISLPNINISEANIWKISEDETLIAPFSEIKGIGDVASKAIVEERNKNGLYASKEDLENRVPKRKVNKKVRDLLIKMDVFSESNLNRSEAELEELSQYFDFNLSNDPLYRFRKVMAKIGSVIDITPVSEAYRFTSTNKFYFGKVTKLTIGYRSAAEAVRDGQSSGYEGFGSLGGVYCNIKDDSSYRMLVFGNDIYGKKKEIIEHCKDGFLLTNARGTPSKGACMTQEAWFSDEIMSGDLEGLEIPLIKPAKTPDWLDEIYECSDCELRGECRKPIKPTIGQTNVMIIGEAGGKDEDRMGEGFVGKAGQILWNTLREYGLDKKLFIYSNICKCFPSVTRTPKKKHVDTCSKFINREIEDIKPPLILAFGNTCNLFFRGESSGIMSINGKTMFNDKHDCWITYSVHPAMVAYSPENMPEFRKGIEEFVKKVEQFL